MYIRFLFILLVSIPLNIQSAESKLSPGYCVFDGGKKYLSDHFQQEFPRQVEYLCSYACQTETETLKTWIEHKLVISNLTEEARNTTCFGVSIKEVPWGFELGRIDPFYAFDIAQKNFRTWAQQNMPRIGQEEYLRLNILKESLNEISEVLKINAISNKDSRSKADILYTAEELQKVAKELPEKQSLLRHYLNLAKQKDLSTKERLLCSILFGYANWFNEPIEQLLQRKQGILSLDLTKDLSFLNHNKTF